MERNAWHTLSTSETILEFKTDQNKGLDPSEAARRLELVGLNQLITKKKISPWAIFLGQFKDIMVLVLIGATIISGILGEYADALTILAIIIINAVLGFVQEYRAEQSLDALKKMVAPEANVVRGGITMKIPASQIVPGDIVRLESGDIVPADLRVCETSQLEVSEAALTGESLPVKKNAELVLEEKVSLGDRKNMCYMGTVITRGKGRGIVVDTGMQTEMGQIAGYIEQVEEEQTPLQNRLAQLGKWLIAFCFLIVGVVVVAGIIRGEALHQMFLTGVSLAVAAIPEGLPAIVTVALAIGVQKMVKKQAIVRALPAVETLGCATVICSDKTGTLTQNEMTVRRYFLGGEYLDFSGEGYDPRGKISFAQGKNPDPLLKSAVEKAFRVAALCNNAQLQRDKIGIGGLFRRPNEGSWGVIGDPTEGALLVSAAKGGVWREVVEKEETRVLEIPFDSERKMMSVVYASKQNGSRTVYSKGAPDILLERCANVFWQGKVQKLSPLIKKQIMQANDEMAGKALRVLGLAYKELEPKLSMEKEEVLENDLIFLALAGMIDPPRSSAVKAIRTCRSAGIKTVMITGDHQNTAVAVAQELRILNTERSKVLSGMELDQLSDAQLRKMVNEISVYARVSPKHKLRIVKALKNAGHIVAMTGDGVNDAPAVKEADIGISMGNTGTDVTKEASALILANDDFATIVAAIREGRIIYDNIRKFIRYLLSSNVGEVLTMFLATIMGLPLPLMSIQILWMNLVTDGLPAMALGLDAGDPDIMERKPRHPRESIFAHGLVRSILVRGTIIALSTLTVYILGFFLGGKDLHLARTMAFTALIFSQLSYVFECRSERYSIFQLGFFTNIYLVGAVSISVIAQLAVIYIPFLQRVFHTVPLNLYHWSIIIIFAVGSSLLQGVYRTVKIMSKSENRYIAKEKVWLQ
ncbi:MAG: cation-translocating P-type ATPase [Peptococcia bacterium]